MLTTSGSDFGTLVWPLVLAAGTPLDPRPVATLDRFMSDVEALHPPRAALDTVGELLARGQRTAAAAGG